MRGIVVHITRDFKSIVCPRQKLRKLVQAVCNRFGLANATVGIAIVGNERISKLNSRFLNRKTVTDCLAFDLSEYRSNHRWFELVVNGERAISEAAKRGHCAQVELALYVTHGLLHNLGLDDLLPKQAQKMHRLEDEILQQQGFGLIYKKNAKLQRPRPRAKRHKSLQDLRAKC
jgi:probable rRNA maturation factor